MGRTASASTSAQLAGFWSRKMTQRQLELRVGGYVKYPVPGGGPLIQPIKWCNLGLEGILCVAHKTSSSRHSFSEGALTTTLLLYNVKVKVDQSCPTLCDPRGLYSPWNSPGQNTGVGSLSLLQGIFPTQGLNPGLPQCRRILYQLSHKGSPRILDWVTYPFSSGSS